MSLQTVIGTRDTRSSRFFWGWDAVIVMENKSTKNSRAKNYTSTEVSVLVEEVEKRRHLLFGPLRGPALTQFHRDRAWEKVVEAVNAVAPVARGLDELKRKFRDLKTRTKQKASAFRREGKKTGGGENDAPPLSANEERLLSFIGHDSIEGIRGGVDTYRKEVFNTRPSPLRPCTPQIPEVLFEIPGPTENASASHSPPLSPIPGTSAQSPPVPQPIPVQPLPGPKVGKKGSKTVAVEEIRRATRLQDEQNHVLRELLDEFRGFRSEMRDFKDQFLQLKKRELDILSDDTNKRRKTNN